MKNQPSFYDLEMIRKMIWELYGKAKGMNNKQHGNKKII